MKIHKNILLQFIRISWAFSVISLYLFVQHTYFQPFELSHSAIDNLILRFIPLLETIGGLYLLMYSILSLFFMNSLYHSSEDRINLRPFFNYIKRAFLALALIYIILLIFRFTSLSIDHPKVELFVMINLVLSVLALVAYVNQNSQNPGHWASKIKKLDKKSEVTTDLPYAIDYGLFSFLGLFIWESNDFSLGMYNFLFFSFFILCLTFIFPVFQEVFESIFGGTGEARKHNARLALRNFALYKAYNKGMKNIGKSTKTTKQIAKNAAIFNYFKNRRKD